MLSLKFNYNIATATDDDVGREMNTKQQQNKKGINIIFISFHRCHRSLTVPLCDLWQFN
jgi:hypothetical protein